MLSYPLCPFFVVFCNVVGTSNAKDFQLLQDVTDGISTLVAENKFVNRLHRLCTTLIGLCKPLVRFPTATIPAQFPGAASVGTNPLQSSALPANGTNLDGVACSGRDGTGFNPSSWNDDMMWQLFQSQPSLDWFNTDILDPAWDITLPK